VISKFLNYRIINEQSDKNGKELSGAFTGSDLEQLLRALGIQ
jgi:hypothetical protein